MSSYKPRNFSPESPEVCKIGLSHFFEILHRLQWEFEFPIGPNVKNVQIFSASFSTDKYQEIDKMSSVFFFSEKKNLEDGLEKF